MFKNRESRRKLFYKYMSSYLIIFLIPYLLISTIFYNISMSNLRDEIILSNIQNIEQVSEFTDLRMQELENVATRIALSTRLTPYKLNQPYNKIEAIEDLSSFKVNSTIIDELYLYFQGENEIYSSQGTSLASTFQSDKFQIKSDVFDSANILKATEYLTRPLVLPIDTVRNGRQEHMISYVFPISPNSAFSYGTVFFLVNEMTLKQLIHHILRDFDGNIYVFNENDELLTSSSNGEQSIDDIKNLALDHTGVIDKQLNDENYSLVTVRSALSDWTFVTAMPTDQFYDKMASLKTWILSILSIIALLGISFSVLLSFRQYQPIQGLLDFIKQKQVTYLGGNNKNEFETIRETIKNIHDDSEQLQKKMKVNQPLVREHLLLKLLGDSTFINHKTEYSSPYKELLKTFKGNTFFVIVIFFKEQEFEQDSLQHKEDLLHLVNHFTSQDNHGYGLELINDNAIVVIVNMPDHFEQLSQSRYHYVNELTHRLQPFISLISGISVGEICQGTDKINRSFIEANAAYAAIKFKLAKNNLPIYFEEIKNYHEQQKTWHPIDNQNKAKLIQSLQQGNQIVAKEALKTILSDLKRKDITIHIVKCLCFDVINTILENTPEKTSYEAPEIVKAIVDFRSLDNLEYNMNILIAKICDDIQKRKMSNNLQLRDNILEYIRERYKSHDLSLDEITEKFQLSPSYLSRFIKEQTGNTFTQYVWNLRINEFKRQLVETDLPIKILVADIGYIDIASFSKRFKKAEGLTPGQYRNFHAV